MSSDRFATRPSGSPQGDEQRMSRSGRPGTLLITISGKSGCGNSTVSRLVAERLGLRLINFTLRDLARERGLSFEQMWERAEYDQSVDHELDRRLMELAADGECVLGTRAGDLADRRSGPFGLSGGVAADAGGAHRVSGSDVLSCRVGCHRPARSSRPESLSAIVRHRYRCRVTGRPGRGHRGAGPARRCGQDHRGAALAQPARLTRSAVQTGPSCDLPVARSMPYDSRR